MTPFDRAERMASRAVDWMNAVDVELMPLARLPNGRAASDPARQSVIAKGVLDQRATPVGLQLGDRQQGSRGNDFRTLVGATHYELSVDRVVYADFIPRQGDHIHIPDRDQRFAVTSVRPDGAARVVLYLEEIQ